MGRNPQNIQVVLEEADGGTKLDLQDVDGVFLEVGPPGDALECEEESEEGGGADDVERLKEFLEVARRERRYYRGR